MRLFNALLIFLPLALSSPFDLDEREPQFPCKPPGISQTYADKVSNALLSSGVVPTLVPPFTPKLRIAVDYPSMRVRLGNEFTTSETITQPSVKFTAQSGVPSNANFSVFMLDPDVPNPDSPARVPYLHWYFAHVSSFCTIGEKNIDTVTTYQSPSPLSTQQHRYTFLVYREPPGYKPDAATAQIRAGFDVVTYAQNAKLTLVGANFFLEAITNT